MCEKQHLHVQHADATQMMKGDFTVDPDDHMAQPKRYSNSYHRFSRCVLPDRVPLLDRFTRLVMMTNPRGLTVVIDEL